MNHIFKSIKIPRRQIQILKSLYRQISNFEEAQTIQVSVLGACCHTGKATSFLLKQNPVISTIHLHGHKEHIRSLATDLCFFDTKTRVQTHEGNDGLNKAVRCSDVILILPQEEVPEDATVSDRVILEGKRLAQIAQACTKYAPKSTIVVCIPPVTVMTPVVAGIFKETYWYNPGRIIGSAMLAQIKANTILGRYQNLDPRMCHVPLIGGADVDVAVPLFTKGTPVEVSEGIAKSLLAEYRGIPDRDFPKKLSLPMGVETPLFNEACALNRLVTTIGLGICGEETACCSALVRSNIISTCQHLVTTVRFARGGVVHNFGVPRLTKMELDIFERATLKIKEKEEMASQLLATIASDSDELPPFKVKENEQKEILQREVIR